jgi:hypothetical protein
MRISRGAYGIIKHRFKNADSYLLQINPGWENQFNFISGHIEPEDKNDYKNTMIREIEEELNPIKYKKQFDVKAISNKPFHEVAYSLSAGEKTRYTFSIFHVIFLVPIREISFLWENNSPVNCWFTEEELRQGIGKRGEKITRFPVPQIIDFIPGGLKNLADSFISTNSLEEEYAIR